MKKMQQFLEQSSEHMTRALSNSRVIITAQDTSLRYTWVFNPGENGHKDAVGKKLEDFANVSQIDAIMPLKRKALKTGKPQQKLVDCVVDGVARKFDMTVVPVFEEQKLTGLITFSVDLTDFVTAQEELHQAHARLLGMLGDKMIGGKAGRHAASDH
jgi:transcriptional regulator with PAS, ATPase and Fis domain